MSRTLYFDARNTFNISSSTGKYNGGNNYAIALLKRLLSNDKVNVLIICPKNATDYVLNQYSISVDKLITESSLKNITFYDNSIYFNPLVSDTKHFLDELIYVKSNNPTLKIRLTIHDRRHHEDIIDKYNGILNEGIKHNYFILGVGRFINSIKKDIIVKKILHLSDEVFTVSNYSMQELLSLGNTNYISCYVQPIQFTNRTILVEGNYVLFVSAGRSEKNFIRALKAFEQYVKNKNDKDVRLRVTGLNDRQKTVIKDKHIIDETILDYQVDLLGYINGEEFSKLYAECKFLLFTSKSEGFGLPVAEAMFFNKPVVASRLSSIPEVMGSAAIYVDPYSIDSIASGIEKMMDTKTYNKYVQYTKDKRTIWEKQVVLDNQVLIERITE